MIKKLMYAVVGGLFFTSCAIENDIPYPVVDGAIADFRVEGQRAAEEGGDVSAVINKNERTIQVYVNDSVNLSRLKITQLSIEPSDAVLLLDSSLCDNAEKFPFGHFASLDSIALSANTRVDFSEPVNFTIRTYQDYVWKVMVEQIFNREIEVDGMTSKVLDPVSRTVIINVNKESVPDLSEVKVKKLNLGGEYGRVKPEPSEVHDFSSSQTFYAQTRSDMETNLWTEWKVFVYHDKNDSPSGTAEVFAMCTQATLKGSVQSGKTPVVEYREQGDSLWEKADEVKVSGTSYTATITGLSSATTYEYRVSVDGVAGSEQTFTTAREVALTNGSLEDWHQDGKQWNPWTSSGSSFWGTGNKGTSIIGSNITTPVDESVSGKAALLASRYVPLKGLAAGNLFTGDFDLDGLNGVLTLGREFNSFPTGLRVNLKYVTSKITQTVDRYADLKGQNDMCHIYVALTTEKVTIRTKQEEVFDKNASSVIAYGEYISDKNVSGSERNNYKQVDIPLTYKRQNQTPKYLIIVCSASRYGDFFTGGEESKLWLDEMELVYE